MDGGRACAWLWPPLLVREEAARRSLTGWTVAAGDGPLVDGDGVSVRVAAGADTGGCVTVTVDRGRGGLAASGRYGPVPMTASVASDPPTTTMNGTPTCAAAILLFNVHLLLSAR